MSEFKWLCNPSDRAFDFQYDSICYQVPALQKQLLLKEVAEHGEKRSISLSDPTFDAEGNVVSSGNDVVRWCYTQDADISSAINYQEPIILEISKDHIENVAELSVDPTKPIKAFKGKSKKKLQPVQNVDGGIYEDRPSDS